MIPFKLIPFGFRMGDCGISETVYRNASGIDTMIGLAIKYVTANVPCMIISAELNERNLVRRVAKQYPIEQGQKPPTDFILYAFNDTGVTPQQCIDVLEHRKTVMGKLPRVVFVDWLDFKDFNDTRELDVYGKRNEVLIICKKQVPYYDDGLPI
jgi:hypothetical protein